jgi:RNA polymerase II subunit A C-terminal domain phosphatase
VGDTVERDDKLFLYTYTTKVTEGSRDGEEDKEVDKILPATFSSTLNGRVTCWRVWTGDVLYNPVDVVEIEEDCPHTIQFQGMCTNCGRDMTEVQAGSHTNDADRAPIRMDPGTQYLTISRDEANRVDEEAKRRLLASRKLSLVVDLDQTIIHAAVDPTIAEWQKEPDNPNFDAVKDVRSFQLKDDGPGMHGCWYYIKLRPGLQEFLESIARIYELYIYTMGTRQYAEQIAKIVDPQGKYFGDRILSRDESGSMIVKNLERLFPVDTKMVVIIDDRADVWKWSPNLIRVTQFEFFKGIGDINSSFLPKQDEIKIMPKEIANNANGAEAAINGEKGDSSGASDVVVNPNGESTLEQMVAMGGSDSPETLELQKQGVEQTISAQQVEKPLEKLQREQDERDEAEAVAAEQAAPSTNGETQTTGASTDSDSSDSSDTSTTVPIHKPRARHSVLRNDDEELIHLEERLNSVHSAFFTEYDRKRLGSKGGRVAALSGGKKAPLPSNEDDVKAADLALIPDVKKVMPAMKQRVLGSVTLVFSGVLPLGTDIQNADLSMWAKSFGATIVEKVSRDVTHVVAARPGTAKVKQAIKRNIKVVETTWLVSSMQQWRKLDERPFLLEGAGKQKQEASSPEHEQAPFDPQDFDLSESESDVTGQDTEMEDNRQPRRKKLKLSIDTPVEPAEPGDGETSPLTINQDEWDEIDNELKEFMGSDIDSESDTESVSSRLSIRKTNGKRKREDVTDDESSPTKRNASGSGLRAVTISDAEINAEQQETEAQQAEDESEEEDSDDELARELERELESAEDGDDLGDEGFMGSSGAGVEYG